MNIRKTDASTPQHPLPLLTYTPITESNCDANENIDEKASAEIIPNNPKIEIDIPNKYFSVCFINVQICIEISNNVIANKLKDIVNFKFLGLKKQRDKANSDAGKLYALLKIVPISFLEHILLNISIAFIPTLKHNKDEFPNKKNISLYFFKFFDS